MTRSNLAAPNGRRDDETLESLRDAHQHLERRLNKLDGHRSLSPEEQYEVQVLKKRKLAIKDRIRSRTPSDN